MKEIRRLRIFSLILAAAILVPAATAGAVQSPQTPLAGSAIPQFMQPLPLLSVQPGGSMRTVMGNQALTIKMCEFQAAVLPPGTIAPAVQPLTWVWGYLVDTDPLGGSTCEQLVNLYKNAATGALDTYLGPTRVSRRDFRDPADRSEGGDLALYAWKHRPRVLHPRRTILFSDIEHSGTVRYAPNTLIAFVNSVNAVHGVTPRAPSPLPRRYINFVATTQFDVFAMPRLNRLERLLHRRQMERMEVRALQGDKY